MEGLTQEFSLERCTKCLVCTQACPFHHAMDLPPAQIVERTLAGQARQALASRGIWLCSSCGACTRACPVDIDVEGLLVAFRREAYRAGTYGDKRIASFHEIFTREAVEQGRVREGRVVLAMRTRHRGPFPRGGLGLALMVKGKLGRIFGKRGPRRRP